MNWGDTHTYTHTQTYTHTHTHTYTHTHTNTHIHTHTHAKFSLSSLEWIALISSEFEPGWQIAFEEGLNIQSKLWKAKRNTNTIVVKRILYHFRVLKLINLIIWLLITQIVYFIQNHTPQFLRYPLYNRLFIDLKIKNKTILFHKFWSLKFLTQHLSWYLPSSV